jgi:hypothetical protein
MHEAVGLAEMGEGQFFKFNTQHMTVTAAAVCQRRCCAVAKYARSADETREWNKLD